MTIQNEQAETKEIVFWKCGYFIADDDAAEQGEILDSVNAFGSEHALMNVPGSASREAMQVLVDEQLGQMTAYIA